MKELKEHMAIWYQEKGIKGRLTQPKDLWKKGLWIPTNEKANFKIQLSLKGIDRN